MARKPFLFMSQEKGYNGESAVCGRSVAVCCAEEDAAPQPFLAVLFNTYYTVDNFRYSFGRDSALKS
jgi:hypothetical protein